MNQDMRVVDQGEERLEQQWVEALKWGIESSEDGTSEEKWTERNVNQKWRRTGRVEIVFRAAAPLHHDCTLCHRCGHCAGLCHKCLPQPQR